MADTRALLRRPFDRQGFEVVEAADGPGALALLEYHNFDLALLDIAMPAMDGLEVLKRIRASHKPSSLPVIMVTGRVETDDMVVAFSLGANDYVMKPIDLRVLRARAERSKEAG
jgi:DNA-binding response OmpR family regulator